MPHSEKKDRLNESHVQNLTKLVRSIQEENPHRENILFVDPDDGGENAKLLIVLQAPGGKALKSEFISRDNGDRAANETNEFLAKSGLKREETILWNVIPWRSEKSQQEKDAEEGIQYLRCLLRRLHKLEAVVLAGKKAQKAKDDIQEDLKVFDCELPGGTNVNCNAHLRDEILETFRKARAYIHRM